MSEADVTATGPLWRWTGANGGSWHFVTIEREPRGGLEALAVMRRLESGTRRGFGSVKVSARIGGTIWSTSVFPDKHRGYLLPVKKAVRSAENLAEGNTVTVNLTVL